MTDCCSKPKFCQNAKHLVVSEDILHDTVWQGEVLITSEVHLRAPAVLTILPGTHVKFASGRLCCPSSLPFASLVIDSGSSIRADKAVFESESGALNTTGGLIVVGTADEKDLKGYFPNVFEDYHTVVSREVPAGFSKLSNCVFLNLGDHCSKLNALTLFRVKNSSEVFLSCLTFKWSGDAALKILGGKHSVDHLTVVGALDSAVALDWNASLNVASSLTLQKSNAKTLVQVLGVVGTKNVFSVKEGAKLFAQSPLFAAVEATTAGSFAGLEGNAADLDTVALPETFVSSTLLH